MWPLLTRLQAVAGDMPKRPHNVGSRTSAASGSWSKIIKAFGIAPGTAEPNGGMCICVRELAISSCSKQKASGLCMTCVVTI